MRDVTDLTKSFMDPGNPHVQLTVPEPPELPAERIIAAVSRHYGLSLTTLTFLPLGLDVQAWTYRAGTAEGVHYFLKLRRGAVHPVSLRVPRHLADAGSTHVVAPLWTRAQQLWADVAGFALTLFPFIDGDTGIALGMQERHWVAFGAALREMHDTPLAPDLARDVPREGFTITQLFRRLRQSPWAEVVTAVQAPSARQASTDASERELGMFWHEHAAAIAALADRFAALGQRLRSTSPALVLCHADVHPNNVLIDTDDRLWLVDWDEVLLAPKECDLMMGVGGLGNYPAGPRETAWFLQGYGGAVIDPVALAFYRLARALGDIGANAEEILRPTTSAAAKRAALERLRLLFAPGYIVSLARPSRRAG